MILFKQGCSVQGRHKLQLSHAWRMCKAFPVDCKLLSCYTILVEIFVVMVLISESSSSKFIYIILSQCIRRAHTHTCTHIQRTITVALHSIQSFIRIFMKPLPWAISWMIHNINSNLHK